MEEQSVEKNPFEELDSRVQRDVEGLLWLGKLEETVEFCGHSFTLKTLNMDEELAAAEVSKQYVETLGQAKAWAAAQIALAVTAVDHDEDFCPPISSDPLQYARGRFQYVRQWFWPVIEFLYAHYVELLERQQTVVTELENLSSRGLPSFSPMEDSSNDQGDLIRELAEEAEPD